ncbi:integrase core domain-containing protein [Brevundimonas nasdae]|uniref:Integrase core domain-containing protein n=2 Tax=Brevundimonas nasdae TaxID=172043 RepID=A0ABX8TLK1_9CAUL|nr:integrase core domain-containing protein [Brevundimonas nasdae]QYC13437.1 integrase core domain-containing protein [Brevundimonas nasdae]
MPRRRRRAGHDRQRIGLSLRPVRRDLRQTGARHVRTRRYTPRTNGKAERFIQTTLREWAYARPCASSDERAAAIKPWTNGGRTVAAVNPALQETAVDRAQMSLRTITSIVDVAAPGLGSVFGELVNVVLTANRGERMAQLVTKLDLRLKALSVQLGALLHNPDAEQLALIEDGLRASARATQKAKTGRISDIVAASAASAATASRKREILDLLSSLGDNASLF